jgi:exonuclease SbcC
MRILQVRFKNLNSLVGEWKIDFTHPAFTADGLFAITGPTGAGKSTVLDALCLALYGRTPRLGKISRSGNEIMSRQTGDCFAEATFETSAGKRAGSGGAEARRFRCVWSQHRSRRRSDGELQAPKHEIADAVSGEVLESSITGVAARIEAVTGMDFDRFTRSMLLAQGGFAAFLQAPSDERAPVLEQITGTEIYSRISVRVHERRAEERAKRDLLRAELAGMRLLPEEEEARLRVELEERSLREKDMSGRIEADRAAVVWLDGVVRLEAELRMIDEAEKVLLDRREQFHPEAERLRRAEDALELAPEHTALKSLREEQRRDWDVHAASLKTLPALEEEVRLAAEAQQRSSETLDAGRKALAEAVPLLRAVQALDLRIRDKEGPVGAAEEALTEGEAALDALRDRDGMERRLLGERQGALEAVRSHLARSTADEKLVEEFPVLRDRFDALRTLDGKGREGTEKLRAAARELEEARTARRKRDDTLVTRRAEYETARGAFDEARHALESLLAGRRMSDWRKDLDEEKERRRLLEDVVGTLHALEEARRRTMELRLLEDAARARCGDLDGEIAAASVRQTALEAESARLEEQLASLRRIADFETERHRLRKGEPCPLCGATEHPFAAGVVPVPDEAAAALLSLRNELQAAGRTLADLRVARAEASKDLEQAETRRRERDEEIARQEVRLREEWTALSKEEKCPEGPGAEALLERLAREIRERFEETFRVVQAAEEADEQCAILRESLEKARENLVLEERFSGDAAHREESAEQAAGRAEAEAREAAVQLDEARQRVLRDLAPYGIGDLASDPEEWEAVLRDLEERRVRWNARQEEKDALEKEIASLELRIDQRKEQIRQAGEEVEKRRRHRDELLRERKALEEERRERFGDGDPDAEERRLGEALKALAAEFDTVRARLDEAVHALGGTRARIAETENAIAEREKVLQARETAFVRRLDEAGFADEDAYLTALLPEEERKALQERARALEEERIALNARRREKAERLEEERRRKATDRSREDLLRELEELERNVKILREELGGIAQKLRENETARETARDRRAALEAQEKECFRIEALHDLIGSADGKKYRNFVQCLTFDILISHANRQLRKMTDRYLLVRNDGQPLELDVIDAYQAGERRSTRNLSGGESFLVSLALALGLSRMASRNVRIDSLFLDEGFGTLDEDALDTALQTLAELRQDGKLIGVISHVAALKERIASQIRVFPLSGGRSGLSGPGCNGSPSAMTAD